MPDAADATWLSEFPQNERAAMWSMAVRVSRLADDLPEWAKTLVAHAKTLELGEQYEKGVEAKLARFYDEKAAATVNAKGTQHDRVMLGSSWGRVYMSTAGVSMCRKLCPMMEMGLYEDAAKAPA